MGRRICVRHHYQHEWHSQRVPSIACSLALISSRTNFWFRCHMNASTKAKQRWNRDRFAQHTSIINVPIDIDTTNHKEKTFQIIKSLSQLPTWLQHLGFLFQTVCRIHDQLFLLEETDWWFDPPRMDAKGMQQWHAVYKNYGMNRGTLPNLKVNSELPLLSVNIWRKQEQLSSSQAAIVKKLRTAAGLRPSNGPGPLLKSCCAPAGSAASYPKDFGR